MTGQLQDWPVNPLLLLQAEGNVLNKGEGRVPLECSKFLRSRVVGLFLEDGAPEGQRPWDVSLGSQAF